MINPSMLCSCAHSHTSMHLAAASRGVTCCRFAINITSRLRGNPCSQGIQNPAI
jgi:hypothetical protein